LSRASQARQPGSPQLGCASTSSANPVSTTASSQPSALSPAAQAWRRSAPRGSVSSRPGSGPLSDAAKRNRRATATGQGQRHREARSPPRSGHGTHAAASRRDTRRSSTPWSPPLASSFRFPTSRTPFARRRPLGQPPRYSPAEDLACSVPGRFPALGPLRASKVAKRWEELPEAGVIPRPRMEPPSRREPRRAVAGTSATDSEQTS